MEVSLNEYVRLASAIDAGRDPAYPDQSQYIWWLWNRVIHSMTFCEEMANCITSENSAVIDALAQALVNNPTLRAAINSMTPVPADSPYGQTLPTEELERDVAAGTNPMCNYDILWSQCLNIVMVTNATINDSLEKLEVSTNIAELVNNLIDAIPLLGTAKQLAGIEGVLDLLNYFQESIAEGYAAQYTTTPGGVQDQIACALFCACKDDCIINVTRVEEVMRARLEAHITVPEVSDFVDLLETIAGLEPDTTYVVDLAFWFGWVAVRVSNFLFGDVFNAGLDLIVALAADEPSNDWILLCDCPDSWEHTFPDTEVWADWTLIPFSGSVTTVVSGELVGGTNTTGDAVFLQAEIEATGDINHIAFDVEYNAPVAGQMIFLYQDNVEIASLELNGGGTGTLEWDGAVSGTHTYRILGGVFGTTGTGEYLRVIESRWMGFGTNPFI